MGQQQLLLLVLGIVIVGLAVVVGIQAFDENMKKSNADALVNDGVRIASEAQAWKLKPAAFGGGADTGATVFTTLTLEKLGYETDDADNGDCAEGEYGNANGCFGVVGSPTNFIITGTNTDIGNQVTVSITGTKSSEITTTVADL